MYFSSQLQPVNMFARAMDNAAKSTTENGRPSLPSTGEARVDAFFKLVRGLTRKQTELYMTAILAQADVTGDVQTLVDAFVLWAFTRDVRSGKGEKELSYWMLASLACSYPETVQGMFELIPEYGSWRDVVALLELECLSEVHSNALVGMMAAQLTKDAGSEKPSLAGKWAPRPKSTNNAFAKKRVAKLIAAAMFPDEEHPLPKYRQWLSALNRRLLTTEVLMCGQQWASIKPGAVPSKCLMRYRAAFMNKSLDKSGNPKKMRLETDRVTCTANFMEYAKAAIEDPSKAQMHGRVVQPHEFVSQYMKKNSRDDDIIIEAQWKDMRQRLAEEFPMLGMMVPLVDVSGSMHVPTRTPLEVAVALGILISEIALLHRFITFSEDPSWHCLDPTSSLREKVQSCMNAKWGMSTDLQKAIDMMLQACKEGNVPASEVGELILVVLSDMQFDAACPGKKPWQTQYQAMVESFEQAGYTMPKIVFWNLRAATRDFPVDSSTPGVDMVSGFSPNMLKLFMAGRLDDAQNGVRTDQSLSVTPYETVRKALDDRRYHAVRDVCARFGEGRMKTYVAPEDLDLRPAEMGCCCLEPVDEEPVQMSPVDVHESLVQLSLHPTTVSPVDEEPVQVEQPSASNENEFLYVSDDIMDEDVLVL